jgi:predicted RNase H-like HicB family nuclease
MKRYLITDGKLVLNLEEAEDGGYVVTHPFDPAVTTQAETLSEAFENARDAMRELKAARRDLRRKSQHASAPRRRAKQKV